MNGNGNSELDLLTSFWINAVIAVAFLTCYALFKNQRLNKRVYFPRWCMHNEEEVEEFVDFGDEKGKRPRYLNRKWKSYMHTMDWTWTVLRKTETEIIELVGLDAALLLRIFLLGLKVFLPMMLWGFVVLVPVNKTDNELVTFQATDGNLTYSRVDTLSIANVHDLSKRLWAHLLASYLFTGWTCLLLYLEYCKVEKLRFEFLASRKQQPDQFTVLVRQVPKLESGENSQSISKSVGTRIQEFFQENHPEHYTTHQVVYKANKLTRLLREKYKYEAKLDRIAEYLSAEPSAHRPTIKKHWYHVYGERMDAIEYYSDEVDRLEKEVKAERKNILSDEKYVMRAGFVSFDTRWGAAVCAQTQQTKNHTKWLTEWAPEPRDVYWKNLALHYVTLNSRRLLINTVVVVLVIFFLIPVAFVQSLANLDVLDKYLPFLKPFIHLKFVRSFIQGYLPALLLKTFILLLPRLLRVLTKFEGHVSYSKIDKYAGFKFHVFMVVNVFFGNVLIGSIFEQLKQYIAAPTTIPNAFGISIPIKATFFMTYIMVDGWASNAAEIFRLWPLLWYHITNTLFVRTEKERVKIIPATAPDFSVVLPRLSLYFLLGLVYAVISPLLLPFLCVFFAFGYLVYRNQVINVYEPRYESAASYWPYIHRNIIIALIIKHITLIGLFSVKRAVASTPFLLPLPVITSLFHLYCCQKFLPGFKNYPLQEARHKDKLELELNIKDFVETAYLHPSIKAAAIDDDDGPDDASLMRNGTAPFLDQDHDSAPRRFQTPNTNIALVPVKHLANDEPDDSTLRPTSPNSRMSSRHIQREGSGSIFSSNRRSNRVHAGNSPAYYEADSSLSSPALSRGSSLRVQFDVSSSLTSAPRDENPHGSFRSSSFRRLRGVGRDEVAVNVDITTTVSSTTPEHACPEIVQGSSTQQTRTL